ncbi:hypothetical protein C7M37_01342 [Lactiplantibacillus plantarum]|nr:hypothetical protein C7M37_01342 [Lactiplantibacillus plantarum]
MTVNTVNDGGTDYESTTGHLNYGRIFGDR